MRSIASVRRLQHVARAFARQAQDFGFRRGGGVADAHVHQEAVELRFGQREGAFLFDRVLRGHHQEQRRQRIGLPPDGDLAFAHRFEQRRLHLRGRAVDLVGEQDRMEDRPGLEFEAAVLRAPDFGAGEVGGQQVGRELHAGEVRVQPRGECADRAGLGQARRAFDQQVPIGQQRDQQALDQRAPARRSPRESWSRSAEKATCRREGGAVRLSCAIVCDCGSGDRRGGVGPKRLDWFAARIRVHPKTATGP